MSSLIADGPSTDPAVTDPLSTVLAGADWAELLAVGVVADDLTPTGIARYAGVDLTTALDALERARTEGVLDVDSSIESRTRTSLVARLTAQRVAAIHAAVARRVLSGSPDDLRAGLAHLREAGAAMPTAELVTLAEHAGRFALDIRDAEAARDLLLLALEHDLGMDLRLEAERNLVLARALLLLGDSTGAQARLMRAVLLAEECGDATIAARAAERFALPADWQAGDPRVAGMIDRVLAMPTLGDEERTRMLAVRGWVESRLPVAQAEGQQVSWVSRPSVARPLAEEALATSASQSSATRLLALLAWRHTHRAPQYLDERRRVSEEAVALAERIGAEAELVEAAVMLAVDALEAGDRPAHRMALTTAGAVADRSGDERLRWRALVPAAGIALMDDDVDAARAIAATAFAAGHASNAPGLLASEWTFTGQLAARHTDPGAIATALATDAATLATSPLGRSGLALLLAREGRTDVASAHAWATLNQLDEESSLLLTLARLADAAVSLSDPELAEELTALLAPWSGRVVVDANSWWCDGPVDLWLAELALQSRGVVGDHDADVTERMNAQLDAATRLAQATGDRRSLRRIVAARDRIPGARARASIADVGLTPRQLEVLHGLVLGETYTQLAARLRFSVSTVRNDVVSVYRKLEVRSRSEAAARAVSLGLEMRAAGK